MKESPGNQLWTLRTRSFSCTDKKNHMGKSKPGIYKAFLSLSHEPSRFVRNAVSAQQFLSYLGLYSKAGICLPTSCVTTKAASQHLLALGHPTAALLCHPQCSNDQSTAMRQPLTTSTAGMFSCCLLAVMLQNRDRHKSGR